MGEPKPTASLSGMLLARKGAARPAMRRPSMFGNHGNTAVSQDDLGWNDMGYDVDPAPNAPMDYDHDSGYNPLAGAVPEVKPEVRQQQERIAERLQVQAEAGFDSLHAGAPARDEDVTDESDQFDDELDGIDASEHSANVPSAPVTPIVKIIATPSLPPVSQLKDAPAKSKVRAPKGSKEKAAFTLRLDGERHLKLRLACAVNNRSAQMLVTDALDAFLDAMPELGQLVARVPGR
jgi:hypothetical protein